MNPLTGMPTAPQMAAGGTPSSGGGSMAPDTEQFGDYSDWAKGELAKGFTPEQLQQTLTDNGVTVKKPHSGNWFTHLLPTIGSVGIPLLGAALAPVTGGTSLLVAAGLSGLGAAGGKLAENAIEGKSAGEGVLGEGLLGAVGGGVGGVAGKALSKGAKFLGGAAENMAAKKAATAGAEDAIETAANTYKDISLQLQKAYNAKDSLAHATNMGYDISNPENLVKLGNSSNDILNDVLNRALANSGPVDLSHYPDIIKAALAKEGGTLGSFEKVALARGRLGYSNTPAAKLLQQLEDLGAGVAKTNGDPNELRTLTTKLGQLAQDAKPSVTAATGAIDPEQRAVYNVINEVRDNVKQSLYHRPEVNDTLLGEIGNIEANPELGITQQLADHLNNIITKAGKGNNPAAQDLLDEISRGINITNLGKHGQGVGQIVTSTGAKARAAAEAGLGEPGLDTHPLLEATHAVSGHGGLLSTAAAGAMHAAKNPAILQTLSRIGALGSKLAPPAGAAIATAPNMGADPVALAGGVPGGGTMGGTMNSQPTNGNDLQTLVNAMEAQSILAPYMAGQSGATDFMHSIFPTLQKNRLLASQMGAIPESFANAGGAQGTGGLMSRISALIPGTAAHQYQQQQAAAAQQLAASLGISPQAAAGLLPQLMQNEGTAAIPQSILSSMSGQLAY